VKDGRVDEDVVLSAPLFANMDRDQTRVLQASLTPLELPRGEVLFHEGERGDRLYVIERGKIKLGRRSNDGRENLLAVLGPGEMFGELSLFDPGPRTATATVVADARLQELGHPDLVAWLQSNPTVAKHLLQALARRLRRTNEALADLVFSDVPGRVAKSLLDLSTRFGEQVDDGLRVAHDLTQEELAQLVGASRETVNKALADFAARGWVRREGRAVVLLDVDRLERRAR
jgi:CRP/FNR family cyclic AMP-dependent transcriptional regulator